MLCVRRTAVMLSAVLAPAGPGPDLKIWGRGKALEKTTKTPEVLSFCQIAKHSQHSSTAAVVLSAVTTFAAAVLLPARLGGGDEGRALAEGGVFKKQKTASLTLLPLLTIVLLLVLPSCLF